MALQKLECPHCRMKSTMSSEGHTSASRDSSYFFFVCPRCRLPLILRAEADRPSFEFREDYGVDRAEQSFEKCGWRVQDSWPKPQYREVEAPVGVPDNIGALFAQSQEVALKGGYDLAVMGYVRVLDMAQAALSLGKLKRPHVWILSLVESGQLTSDLKRWADRVKGLRSDAQDLAVGQAEELATFVHIVLEQIFGVRSRAASFRG